MIVDLTMYFPRSKLKKEKRKKDAAAPPFNILTRLSNAFKRLSKVNESLKRCMVKNGNWEFFPHFFVRTGIKMAIYFRQYLRPIRLLIIVRAVTSGGGWGAPLQFLAKQLTLYQPGGRLCPPQYYSFSDLAPALN